MTCRKCQRVGHITTLCENEKVSNTNVKDGETHVTNEDAVLEFMVAEQEGDKEYYYAYLLLIEEQTQRSASFHTKDCINGGRIPKEWILLDSKSTTDAISNPALLKNIHEVQGSLTIYTQTGKAVTKLKVTVPIYGEVWYCPDGITTILSLAHVATTRLVKFESTDGNLFEVTKDDGSTRIFKHSDHGLYYYDMNTSRDSTWQGHGTYRGNGSAILFNTVAENKTKYTVNDYQRAGKARTIQRRIGRPSTKRYLELANKGRIINCNVTRQDILNAKHIFGPDIGSLKGKTIRKAVDQV
jgi:hypothetical protein